MKAAVDTSDAVEVDEEIPKVVLEMRRQNRRHLFGAFLVVGAVLGCTYYMASKLGLFAVLGGIAGRRIAVEGGSGWSTRWPQRALAADSKCCCFRPRLLLASAC